jgi:hypothetical protein
LRSYENLKRRCTEIFGYRRRPSAKGVHAPDLADGLNA